MVYLLTITLVIRKSGLFVSPLKIKDYSLYFGIASFARNPAQSDPHKVFLFKTTSEP